MTNATNTTNPPHGARTLLSSPGCARAMLPILLACCAGCASVPANGTGSLADVEIVDRSDGRVLPVYVQRGVRWIEGTPGHEYALRVRNRDAGRVLAVMSVDGVNVITGDTATPSQSGYVLDAYAGTEISGWRKSFAQTAAFYFTELPDTYAARTGRPDNIGVIGIALFREKARPVAIDKPTGKIASRAEGGASNAFPAEAESRPAPAAPAAAADAASDDRRDAMRSLAPQIGTGHGRIEESHAQRVAFERATRSPAETIVIRYDRRENLAALGVLPPPVIARRADPFPGTLNFTPDPPPR